jgi:hypothetical protein
MTLQELIALRDHEIHPERKKYFQALINQVIARTEKAPPAASTGDGEKKKTKKKRSRRGSED